MKPLDDELRTALKRREPPPGFTGRVMARVEQLAEERARTAAQPERSRRGAWSPWSPWTWFGRKVSLSFGAVAAMAAVALLAVGIALWQQHRIEQERRQGEAARAQLIEALRVTSAKLNHVRTKVREVTGDGELTGTPVRHRTSSEPLFDGAVAALSSAPNGIIAALSPAPNPDVWRPCAQRRESPVRTPALQQDREVLQRS
jgi:hypothetical protein